MNKVLVIGKYLFIAAIITFGIIHFVHPNIISKYIPLSGPLKFVYVTGLGFILTGVSMLLGKWDKLALTLLGVMLIIIAFVTHFMSMFSADNPHAFILRLMDFLKALTIAGAAFFMARHAKDDRFIG